MCHCEQPTQLTDDGCLFVDFQELCREKVLHVQLSCGTEELSCECIFSMEVHDVLFQWKRSHGNTPAKGIERLRVEFSRTQLLNDSPWKVNYR